ncbi:hypothetical protein IFM89_034800 [Coptis chinensis]|uniref:Uncharacterized protein n=1 Tax=Coptis chinensis TaxID=261450 RepID=A0A835LJJ2_9MAGN|nr:hypothetical protein IFM89_034800 [Coptis chinensis]
MMKYLILMGNLAEDAYQLYQQYDMDEDFDRFDGDSERHMEGTRQVSGSRQRTMRAQPGGASDTSSYYGNYSSGSSVASSYYYHPSGQESVPYHSPSGQEIEPYHSQPHQEMGHQYAVFEEPSSTSESIFVKVGEIWASIVVFQFDGYPIIEYLATSDGHLPYSELL